MRSKWMMAECHGGGVCCGRRGRGVAAAGDAARGASRSSRTSTCSVWKSIIMPNQPLALHRHDLGRTIVALKGGTLDVVDAKGKTKKQMTWESGKAYWLGADPADEQHGDMNRGKEPMEVIVVEMKK